MKKVVLSLFAAAMLAVSFVSVGSESSMVAYDDGPDPLRVVKVAIDDHPDPYVIQKPLV